MHGNPRVAASTTSYALTRPANSVLQPCMYPRSEWNHIVSLIENRTASIICSAAKIPKSLISFLLKITLKLGKCSCVLWPHSIKGELSWANTFCLSTVILIVWFPSCRSCWLLLHFTVWVLKIPRGVERRQDHLFWFFGISWVYFLHVP